MFGRCEHLSELREQADGTFAQRGDNRTYVPGSTDAAPWPESQTARVSSHVFAAPKAVFKPLRAERDELPPNWCMTQIDNVQESWMPMPHLPALPCPALLWCHLSLWLAEAGEAVESGTRVHVPEDWQHRTRGSLDGDVWGPTKSHKPIVMEASASSGHMIPRVGPGAGLR